MWTCRRIHWNGVAGAVDKCACCDKQQSWTIRRMHAGYQWAPISRWHSLSRWDSAAGRSTSVRVRSDSARGSARAEDVPQWSVKSFVVHPEPSLKRRVRPTTQFNVRSLRGALAASGKKLIPVLVATRVHEQSLVNLVLCREAQDTRRRAVHNMVDPTPKTRVTRQLSEPRLALLCQHRNLSTDHWEAVSARNSTWAGGPADFGTVVLYHCVPSSSCAHAPVPRSTAPTVSNFTLFHRVLCKPSQGSRRARALSLSEQNSKKKKKRRQLPQPPHRNGKGWGVCSVLRHGVEQQCLAHSVSPTGALPFQLSDVGRKSACRWHTMRAQTHRFRQCFLTRTAVALWSCHLYNVKNSQRILWTKVFQHQGTHLQAFLANLFQSLWEKWYWVNAVFMLSSRTDRNYMEYYCFLQNVSDLLSYGKNTLWQAMVEFGKPFKAQSFHECDGWISSYFCPGHSVGAMVKPPGRQGSFAWNISQRCILHGKNLERNVSVADIEELEILDASEIHARRLNAKEVITPKSSRKFAVHDRRLRRYFRTTWRRSGSENIHPSSGTARTMRGARSSSRRIRRISTIKRFCWWHRHHVEPRVKLQYWSKVPRPWVYTSHLYHPVHFQRLFWKEPCELDMKTLRKQMKKSMSTAG